MNPGSNSTLFVFSGGGGLAFMIHAGIYRALTEWGIRPTCLSGASAGAGIAAMISCGWSPEAMIALLRSLREDDLKHERFLWKARFWLEAANDNDRLEGLLRKTLSGGPQIPVHVWATRHSDGCKIDLARPGRGCDLPTAVLASMAAPVFFPPVTIDGDDYVDGGLRFNVPLLRNWRDFDRVYICIGHRPIDSYRKAGYISNAVRAFEITMWDQIIDPLYDSNSDPRIRVIWPQIESSAGLLQLDQSLIEQGYRGACDYLRQIEGAPPDEVLR